MKKITAMLGNSHSEFDHQLKDVLNQISDSVDKVLIGQEAITEFKKKIILKQHDEDIKSAICDSCKNKANLIVINISKGTKSFFCDKCLTH